jgi:hypothetical protein
MCNSICFSDPWTSSGACSAVLNAAIPFSRLKAPFVFSPFPQLTTPRSLETTLNRTFKLSFLLFLSLLIPLYDFYEFTTGGGFMSLLWEDTFNTFVRFLDAEPLFFGMFDCLCFNKLWLFLGDGFSVFIAAVYLFGFILIAPLPSPLFRYANKS